MSTFKQFNLQDYLLEALNRKGFEEPTTIQEKVIPQIQKSSDLVVQSQTGTGKTHAFLLPILNRINPESEKVQAVITAPSRELATQIYDMAMQLIEEAPINIRIKKYVGGTDKKRQSEKLENNQPHIAIGTPGRLLDLIESRALKTYTTQVFVVDEGDMTLDMGFLPQVDRIASTMPKQLQMLVFSATIPEKIQPFLKKYMDNPKFIESDHDDLLSPVIDNGLLAVRGRDRKELIYQLVTIGYPYFALIFANTIEVVDEIYDYLDDKGLNVGKLHGDLTSRERNREIRRIKQLDYQFVVATDIAARGIDIEGVSHVINAEIPDELEFFIHRVGRTGRNNMPGQAITLYDPDEEDAIRRLERKGINFTEKELKKDGLVDAKERRIRRSNKKQNKSKGKRK